MKKSRRDNRKAYKRLGGAAWTAMLLLVSLPMWYPLWMFFSGALMDSSQVIDSLGGIYGRSGSMASWPIFPLYPTLRPYAALLLDSGEFFALFWNSVGYVAAVLAGQLVVSTTAAWAFARYEFRLRHPLYMMYLLLMILPFQVTLVSQYISLDALHLLDTRWAIILPGMFSTFSVFIMVEFFKEIPREAEEAAFLDGARPIRVFFHIGLPLGLPGIASMLLLSFFEYWSLIEQPMILLSDMSLWPLSLYLPSVTADSLGLALATSSVVLILPILAFLSLQRYLEQGLSVIGGSIKG